MQRNTSGESSFRGGGTSTPQVDSLHSSSGSTQDETVRVSFNNVRVFGIEAQRELRGVGGSGGSFFGQRGFDGGVGAHLIVVAVGPAQDGEIADINLGDAAFTDRDATK
jgi:hypothetical protein